MIFDVLTDDEVIALQKLVEQKTTWSYIKSLYRPLSDQEWSIVRDYYNHLVSHFGNGLIFGHKDEPYYTGETVEERNPTYSWDTLSETEKEFYLNYKKNE